MLVKDFLKHVSPAVSTTIFDLDAEPGNNKKVDEAGALALAYHFNYNSEVIDFLINADNTIILYNTPPPFVNEFNHKTAFFYLCE